MKWRSALVAVATALAVAACGPAPSVEGGQGRPSVRPARPQRRPDEPRLPEGQGGRGRLLGHLVRALHQGDPRVRGVLPQEPAARDRGGRDRDGLGLPGGDQRLRPRVQDPLPPARGRREDGRGLRRQPGLPDHVRARRARAPSSPRSWAPRRRSSRSCRKSWTRPSRPDALPHRGDSRERDQGAGALRPAQRAGPRPPQGHRDPRLRQGGRDHGRRGGLHGRADDARLPGQGPDEGRGGGARGGARPASPRRARR